jgi:hypothetical protein
MLSRVNPATINTEMYHPAPDYYKLSPNNFTLTFALQFANYSTYIDESIYIVTASLVKKTSEKYLFIILSELMEILWIIGHQKKSHLYLVRPI